jgi:hypothetical protein
VRLGDGSNPVRIELLLIPPAVSGRVQDAIEGGGPLIVSFSAARADDAPELRHVGQSRLILARDGDGLRSISRCAGTANDRQLAALLEEFSPRTSDVAESFFRRVVFDAASKEAVFLRDRAAEG